MIFDSRFHKLHSVELPGLASRTRISSDGRYAATTTFVHGDSYADAGFSTRTSIIVMKTGSVILDLEKLAVTKDGESFHNVDFNYWGVTFVRNSQRFYATLGTGGQTYLVEGNLGTQKARVLRSGVECPSLSPDGTRIAFKKRNPGTIVTWGIAVLDLATLKDHSLAETRNVDDQVEWLDNQTVMYGLPQDAGDVDDGGHRDTGNAHPRRSGFDPDQHVVRPRQRHGHSEGVDLRGVVRHSRWRVIRARALRACQSRRAR